MTTAVTAAEILRHTTAFLSDVISNRDLRHRLISILHRDTTTAAISDESAAKLAADTLETAIMLSNFASRSCSLSLAEKLLLPLSDHPLPFFLLSLVHTLHNRHLDAAVSLLRFFRSNPSLARSEIAPVLYDRLFSLQLLSVFRWLLERRAQILSSSSVSEDATHSLSKVSEEQASKLRELEREYEEILDENCRAVAARFEEVLASENASISPPLLARKSSGEAGGAENNVEVEEDEEEQLVMEETEMIALKSGHYDNPIWSEREEASIEFLSSGSCSNSSYAPFYPRRVSPTILKPQNSSQNLASLADETESSLVDKSLTSSSSESEAEREITSTSCSKRTPNLVVGSSEESIASSVAQAVLSEREIEAIVGSLGAEWAEERVAAVEILLKCMQEDGTCRNIIADKAQLSTFLESLVGATEGELFKIVKFLSELVKLNRRTFNEQILHIIKEEGPLSTMHTLLISLQTAHQFHFPVLAGLLLQLDLLVEQTKMSIYSEEAIDTLISCLRKTDYPAVQLEAAKIIASLQGRFNYAGKSLSREVLLERAGLDRSYNNFLQMDQISNFNEGIEASMKEENAAEDWERKAASVLVSHDCGLLFEALADGLKSQNEELRSACFISATWLIYMITILPDTGIQGAARVFFLKHFIFILKSAEDTEDRILAMLALKSFLHFDDGLRDLTSYAKDILKALRELEGFSPMASEIMKVLVEEPESKADIWIHKEVTKIDCSGNGEVLSIICFEDKIFSGHSDGTIKVWKVKESIVDLLQEIKRHTKDVTSLAISESGDRLYSGSLDRTVKVWSIEMAAIHHVQEHDMKDHIHNLVVTNSMCCFSPHGSGIKVKSWNGESKLLNSNKHAKCLALVQGKLYCGCHDSSIQEIDLATGKLISIQSGSKKLLGKANPIHALKLHGEFIYATSSSFDGSVIKIWNTSNNNRIHMVGSLQTSLEVRAMAVSSELIYLGCKGGAVEIWDRKKYNRINTLHTGSNYRVVCMALNSTEDILVIGTSDGQIQAWGVK
ncbi:putative E3 ubiquitin-protein ligase LIN-1 isoform X1 [Arachis duranensis]|uniref:E3 ubiquitin-protein ligase LIN-1 isoform X1 n=1 Tax=Arachis duranensis TaxID=130453 RepID=A0A9C6TKP5_ARADU|nr:putative E3 ubiquitin-protein ligase LIN-1 isoform X1 [Arachis duranensis]